MRHAIQSRASRVAIAVLALSGLAVAGPIWCEPAPIDAGSLPATSSTTKGDGMNAVIKGELMGFSPLTQRGGVGANGDFQDMYLIRIVDPSNFLASTSPFFPSANANFNSQLFLFDFQGQGVLGNLNDPNDPAGASTLRPVSNDGSGSAVVQPGLYYLAISGAGSVPTSPAGAQIFQFLDPFEISGPDGVMPADNFIDNWSGNGAVGNYQIVVQGVSFAEAQCLGDCDLNGFVNFQDLICILFDFGTVHVESDCDVNGQVDFNDLICTLFQFGPCDIAGSEK